MEIVPIVAILLILGVISMYVWDDTRGYNKANSCKEFYAVFHRTFGFSIDKQGVWFDYELDEVCWLWPWKRTGERPRKKYLSLSFDASFYALGELKDMWHDFYNYAYEKIAKGVEIEHDNLS